MPKIATLKPRIQTTSASAVATWTDDQRIRGTTLQNIRKAHFERHPLCVRCAAMNPPRTRAATELDHITPLHQGGRDDASNRQGLCHDCHSQKSKGENAHLRYQT